MANEEGARARYRGQPMNTRSTTEKRHGKNSYKR